MSTRTVAALAALAVALAVAFVVAPRPVASKVSGSSFADERDLGAAVRTAFVEYWGSGERTLTPGMARAVDYWLDYHVAKAVFAALLLVVLAALGLAVWQAFLRSGGVALASVGVVVTLFALTALVLVMANIQGVVAPFSSLLPMVPVGAADGRLAEALDQVRAQLSGAHTTPPLDAMIGDFARYHAAMAVIGAVVAILIACTTVLLWKRFASTASSDWLTRRVLASFGVLSVVITLVLLVVVVANAMTAADPTPALSAFFDGGW